MGNELLMKLCGEGCGGSKLHMKGLRKLSRTGDDQRIDEWIRWDHSALMFCFVVMLW